MRQIYQAPTFAPVVSQNGFYDRSARFAAGYREGYRSGYRDGMSVGWEAGIDAGRRMAQEQYR